VLWCAVDGGGRRPCGSAVHRLRAGDAWVGRGVVVRGCGELVPALGLVVGDHVELLWLTPLLLTQDCGWVPPDMPEVIGDPALAIDDDFADGDEPVPDVALPEVALDRGAARCTRRARRCRRIGPRHRRDARGDASPDAQEHHQRPRNGPSICLVPALW
jgi:hypothetical protein